MLNFHRDTRQKILEIEEIIKETLLFPTLVIVIVIIILIASLFLPIANIIHLAEAGIHWRRGGLGIAFDDFIEFAAVEPYAPALGAVIDFDSGAFGHHKVYIASWTFHIGDALIFLRNKDWGKWFAPGLG